MKIFTDVSPAFYKTLLFNELNKYEDILVVYQENPQRPFRDGDFLKGEKQFKFINQSGRKLRMVFNLINILWKTEYDELVVGGYNTIYPWVAVLLSPRRKNACIIESTLRETKRKGIREFAKRLFFRRVNKAYVCGKSHADLVKAFGFKGCIIDIGSVGFIRRVEQPPFKERRHVSEYLFVGRLTAVKNLEWLIGKFSLHPELSLTIIGTGELEEELKKIAPSNVHFLGAVDNTELPNYYRAADVFILPSYSETYGIVVEEALNNGTPVFVSNTVGCQDNLVAANNVGLVFELGNDEDFERKLKQMNEVSYYNHLRLNVSKMNFEEFEQNMVKSFLK